MKKKEQEKKEHKRKCLENVEEKKRHQEEAKKKRRKLKLRRQRLQQWQHQKHQGQNMNEELQKSSIRHHLLILRVVTLTQLYTKIHLTVKSVIWKTISRDLHHSVQSASLCSKARTRKQQLAVACRTVDDGFTGDV